MVFVSKFSLVRVANSDGASYRASGALPYHSLVFDFDINTWVFYFFVYYLQITVVRRRRFETDSFQQRSLMLLRQNVHRTVERTLKRH